MTSHESTSDIQAQQLCRTWGWEADPPACLLEHAQTIMRVNPQRLVKIGQIAVKLGLVTNQEIEARLAEQHDGEQILAFLGRIFPAKIKPRMQQILAISKHLAYYETIPDQLLIHEVLKNTDAVRQRCDQLDAVLLIQDNVRPILLFTDSERLLHFRQQGAEEQAKCAILRALTQEGGNKVVPRDILLGLSSRSEISNRLMPLRGESKASAETSAAGKLFYREKQKGERHKLFVEVLEKGIELKASDVSIEAERDGTGKVTYRIDGLREYSYRINAEERQTLVSFAESLSGANPQNIVLRKPVTGRVSYRGEQYNFDMRCSFIPGDRRDTAGDNDTRMSVSMRYLPQEDGDGIVKIEKLNFEPDVLAHLKKALGVESGVILLVGPTNSGKSTTIGGFLGLHYLLYGDTKKRLSLEDPVERNFKGVEQFSLPDAESFTLFLEGFLRHDPDVIFIGEVRSAAAALVATRAAKTGHLVLTTFHAPSPIEGYAGVAHLMEEKREYDLLQSLVMIISQRLVRKLCEHCRVKRAATEDELGRFEYAMTRLGVDVASLDLPEHLWFAPSEEGNTCEHCKGKGTAGVVPIHGVLDFTPKVRRLLLEGKLSEVEELQAFRLEGQILRKLEVGDISLEEACL
ncbi:hypothetical protein IPC71_26270 [Pseudomonas aeruginosa]|uniref:GspE/PulE family protein n=1 Tax=Pseudomonas aeruginosa TaxID=287 RepID=UPI00106892AC|nr:ATPase, T2SS/T4P/T4SS family [Pseudomonas aeruginosa]TEP72632.1 hypothetical protein IPC71_26270 [Pseudomonas aeruginosa]